MNEETTTEAAANDNAAPDEAVDAPADDANTQVPPAAAAETEAADEAYMEAASVTEAPEVELPSPEDVVAELEPKLEALEADSDALKAILSTNPDATEVNTGLLAKQVSAMRDLSEVYKNRIAVAQLENDVAANG